MNNLSQIYHRVSSALFGQPHIEKAWQDVVGLVKKVAPAESPVVLLGETGVGKGVMAGLIHRLSTRAEGPFIRVNCGATRHPGYPQTPRLKQPAETE